MHVTNYEIKAKCRFLNGSACTSLSPPPFIIHPSLPDQSFFSIAFICPLSSSGTSREKVTKNIRDTTIP